MFLGPLLLLAGGLLLVIVSPWSPTLAQEEKAEPNLAYCPDLPVTRGEAAAFVAQAWGLGDYRAAGPSFADVPESHWAYGYIEALEGVGIVNHCGDQPPTFCPNSPITRAEAVTWLIKAQEKSPLPSPNPSFQDVVRNHWAYGYIERAFRDGVITVCPDPESPLFFCPKTELTRSDLAIWITRAKGWQPYDKRSPSFSDVPSEHAAYAHIERLHAEGVRVKCLFPAATSGSTFLGIDWSGYYHRYRGGFLAAGTVLGLAALGLTALSLKAGVFLLAFTLPFQQRGVDLGFFSLSAVDFVLWSVLTFWILGLLKQGVKGLRRHYSRLPLTILPLLVAGLLFLPSFHQAVSLSLSVKEYIRYFIAVTAYLFMYLYFTQDAKQRQAIKTSLSVLLFGGVFSVFVLLWQYSHSGIFTFREIARLNVYPFRQTSFFIDPNYYGEFLATLLPISIGLYLTAKSRARVLFLASAFLFILGVLLAFSRAGFAAMLVAAIPLVIYLAILYPPPVRSVFAGGVGVVAVSFLTLQLDIVRSRVMLLFQLWANRLGFIGGGGADAAVACNPIVCRGADSARLAGEQLLIDSAGQRMNILRSAVSMIVHNPWVGVGLGNFERQFAIYSVGGTGGSYRAAHNTFLRLMAETGVFAFIAYLVFLVFTLGYLMKALRRCQDAAWRPILAGLLAGWIGSLVASLFLDQFFEVYYWIYLGITMAAARQAENETVPVSPSPTARGSP